MNKEIIVPMIAPSYSELFSMKDPKYEGNPESETLGFTKKQRDWWLRVYTNGKGIPQCGFMVYNKDRGFFRCAATQKLQIHHIVPSAWIKEQYPEYDPNDLYSPSDKPNGIALCDFHHHDKIHPDISHALHNYGQDKNGIARAITDHRELASRGVKFWNYEYDEMLTKVAEKYVYLYLREHPEDQYPQDTKWH